MKAAVPTAIAFGRGKGPRVLYHMGIAPLVDSSDFVQAVHGTETGVCFTPASGARLGHAVDASFLQ